MARGPGRRQTRTEAPQTMTNEALTRVPRETRFPLNLAVSIPAIDRLYEESKLDIWAPADDVDWTSGQLDAIASEQLQAARRVWSRRAWLEYTGIAETPALLLRFCLERGRERSEEHTSE